MDNDAARQIFVAYTSPDSDNRTNRECARYIHHGREPFHELRYAVFFDRPNTTNATTFL